MFLVTYPRGGYDFFSPDQNVTAPRVARESNGQLFKVLIEVHKAVELDLDYREAPQAEF